jgi:hypothetical protein
MADEGARGRLLEAVAELEAFSRGELPLAHYVENVAPVQLAEKSWRLGYPAYQAGMDRLWAALFEAGLSSVTPAAYNDWLARNEAPAASAAEIARLGREELLLRLFAVRRGERFCDGYWTGLLEAGLLLAYARRLAELMPA